MNVSLAAIELDFELLYEDCASFDLQCAGFGQLHPHLEARLLLRQLSRSEVVVRLHVVRPLFDVEVKGETLDQLVRLHVARNLHRELRDVVAERETLREAIVW